MRPISLTVSGLQSFRESQEVPFHELCSGGVFGIFGPTGSGKSTILDAVTLALYGKVERAAGGTHGIMNQAEDKLSVSFSFQLGEGSQQKKYKVERSFKRSGEHSIRTSTCRLIEIADDESVVHADKERDVTRLVQELIGLTIDDFTRAVVLPQGKFAEFLSLKGADRRQMLQRLFQLEKYGDVLNLKLKKRSDEQKNRFNEILAEQTGLGEASLESLENAALLLKEKEEKLQIVSERLKEEEENVKTLVLFWDAQVQNEKLLKEKDELEKLRPDMDRLQWNLKRAVHADRLQPYADAWKISISNEKKIRDEQEQLRKRTEEFKSSLVEHEVKFDAIRKARSHEEPALIEKRSSLKEVFEWEKMLKEKNQSLAVELKEHEELVSAYDELKQIEIEAARVLKRGKEKQSALKNELSEIEIKQDERGIYQQAVLLSQRIKDVDLELQKNLKDMDATESEINETEHKKSILHRSYTESLDKGKKLSNDIQQLYEEVWEAIRENEQMTYSLQNELSLSKNKQEQLRINHLAAQLSAQLKENEPCSVCGSTVHPSPVDHIDQQEVADYGDKIQDLEIANESLMSQYYHLKHDSEILEKCSRKLWNRLDLAVAETAASDHSITIEDTNEKSEFSFLQVDSHITKAKGIQQDRKQLEGRLDSLINKLEDEQKQLERLSLTLDNGEKQREKLRAQISSIQEKNEEFRSEWKQAEIPFSPDSLKEKLDVFQKRENRQSEIHKSLTVADEFLDQQTNKLESAREEKADKEIHIKICFNQQDMLKKEIQLLKGKISNRIGDQSAQSALDHIESQLNKLKENYSRAEEAYEKSKNQYLESDKAYHTIIQRLFDAQERRERAETEWEKHLIQSDFSSFEDFECSLTNEEIQKKWELEIAEYQDQWKANTASLLAMKEKLPSETLTAAQVHHAKEQLELLKKDTDDTREAVGEARQQWITIEKNHNRFKELEKEKNKVTHLLEQLGKLQSVFRGNAFVEFMAEEQLHHVTRDASGRLAKLTRGRYAIEVDSSGGFVIRDDANGGIKRPVTSLSGGETFLTSLSLALSLSAQIQLRGKFPLQFFFLDEGFGTLDQELLDTVVTALEKVQMENFSIGVISHVPELRARLTKRLIVEPAEHSGRGTRVKLDQL